MTMPRHWRGTLRAAMRTQGYKRHRPRDTKALRRRLEAGEPLDRAVRRTVRERRFARDVGRIIRQTTRQMTAWAEALAPAFTRFGEAMKAYLPATEVAQAAKERDRT